MRYFAKIAAVTMLTVYGNQVQAQDISSSWIAGGAFFASGYRTLHRGVESAVDLQISEAPPLSPAFIKQVDSVANASNRVSLTLVEKGKVIYSRRKDGIKDGSFIISYSMAKSLTSMMVGYALCAGHIKSLDDKLGEYVPELASTAYGESSIRHLLTMSSGADAGGENGEPYQGFGSDLRDQKTSYMSALLKYKDARKRFSGLVKPGEEFEYKNLDTAALSLLIEKATGQSFGKWYEETLVASGGLARTTAWQLDKDKRPLAHGFYFATPDDWVRLGLLALNAYKGTHGSCLSSYMKQAVSQSVAISRNSEHARYGYQFWTAVPRVNNEVFYMRGTGGQSIAIDPQQERVMVAFSTKPDGSVIALFQDWLNSH